MPTSTIVGRTKTRWYLATNELFDSADGAPFLDWNTLLASIKGGTKHQRSYLLKSVRGFMEALVEAPRDLRRGEGGSQFVGHLTVLNWYWEVRHLVVWMTQRNIWRFSSLTSEDICIFAKDRKRRADGQGEVTPNTYYFRLKMLRELWRLRSR
ncbi:hypothetical protein WDZ92_33040, partial [Nostoc sp. NIES-2111]